MFFYRTKFNGKHYKIEICKRGSEIRKTARRSSTHQSEYLQSKYNENSSVRVSVTVSTTHNVPPPTFYPRAYANYKYDRKNASRIFFFFFLNKLGIPKTASFLFYAPVSRHSHPHSAVRRDGKHEDRPLNTTRNTFYRARNHARNVEKSLRSRRAPAVATRAREENTLL